MTELFLTIAEQIRRATGRDFVLQGHRPLFRYRLRQLDRFFLFINKTMAADHFSIAKSCSEPAAEQAKGQVRISG